MKSNLVVGNGELIYICSPYKGEIKRNKRYARQLTKLALDSGFSPITVHLYITEVTNEEKEEERKKRVRSRIKNIIQM